MHNFSKAFFTLFLVLLVVYILQAAVSNTNGSITLACGDLTNAAASCATDATSASNISSGTLPLARLGTSVAARALLGNSTAAVGTPTFATTADVMSYQTAEIPAINWTPSDFTTSGVGTSFEAIPGLSWTFPANTPLNIGIICTVVYQQNTANAAVSFGVQDVTVAPTNAEFAAGFNSTLTLTSTTATAVQTLTPPNLNCCNILYLNGLIEQPSNASASVFRLMVSTAVAADTVLIKRDSFCRVG